MAQDKTELYDCGHWGNGYGKDSDGKTYCYQCCAVADRAEMVKEGKIMLYLCLDSDGEKMRPGDILHHAGKVTNWPGSLEFVARTVKAGYHNIAGIRYDVWFRDWRGRAWHGVTYGDNTQICHCTVTKGKC